MNLYLPDGSKVEVPDDDAAAVLASTPDLSTVEDWRSTLGSRHSDLYPPGGPVPSPS